MKLFEFADALRAIVPGAPPWEVFWREFVSCFTTVSEDEWTTQADPSVLPTDETLKAMTSQDKAFSVKFARAIYARLDIDAFSNKLDSLELATQTLMAEKLNAYGAEIELDDFVYGTCELLVEILYAKAKPKDDLKERLRKIRIQAQMLKYRDLLLVRARGCAVCHQPLTVSSHGKEADSYEIVFLGSEADKPGASDYSVLCKPCAERYELSHTAAEVELLRNNNRSIAAREVVDAGMAPLGLDSKIADLLHEINDNLGASATSDTTYDVVPLKLKINEPGLLYSCRDQMALYEHVVRDQAKILADQGRLDFDLMCHQFHGAWIAMRKSGLTQYAMWERLVEWVETHTNADKYVCGIIVSFMVQRCEVFDKPKGVSA